MRKFILFLSVLVAVVSCNKNQSVPVHCPSGESGLSFTVRSGALLTKSEKTESEKTVNSLIVAIFDSNGVCEWLKKYSSLPSGKEDVVGISKGSKRILACANKNLSLSVGSSVSEFTSLVTNLSENSRNGFVMFGEVNAEASGVPTIVDLELYTVAAKFDLAGRFILDWESDAPESFSITDVYLTNVGSKSDFSFSGSYSPSVNPRNPGVVQNGYESLTLVSSNWTSSGTRFGDGSALYGYPNDRSSADTYLIIKALFNGEVCYYPFDINDKIKEDGGKILSNTSYKFGDITITCKGVKNPYDDFSKIKVLFSVKVTEWKDENLGDIYF